MKAVNLETIRSKNGTSTYEIVKSLINESNFTDEDFEYEIPIKKKKRAFFYTNRYQDMYSK